MCQLHKALGASPDFAATWLTLLADKRLHPCENAPDTSQTVVVTAPLRLRYPSGPHGDLAMLSYDFLLHEEARSLYWFGSLIGIRFMGSLKHPVSCGGGSLAFPLSHP
jgi:hypothetical protein